ncbi:MAG TPA: DNA repair protein [Pseudolabrys sp.]|nr:DNA repair protein [Pseudolabrys sp.]
MLPATLNEIAAARESEMTAATGFLLPLAAWTAGRRAVIWIAEDMALAENGAPYGPGLDAFGLVPERLIRIAVSNARDVPWAMEEALRSRGVGAVIGELRGGDIGLTASRRLSLAAGRDGATAFLLRAAPSPAPLAAATRWVIGTAPSAHGFGPGPPRFSVHLARNRQGQCGSCLLEWNSDGKRFDITAADRQPLAEAPFDRPPRAATGS